MKESISIFISGDFATRLRVIDVINSKNYKLLYNDLLPIINKADISITNLESPLLEDGIPISKTGPNLKSPLNSIEALSFAEFDMVTLANNHIMDYGLDGYISTIRVCKQHNIRYIGIGNNVEEAKKIQYFKVKNQNIGFINCCENEWSTTNGNYPGCNPLNEVSLYYQITEAKKQSDYVVLIIHGGHETYEYPSPRMKKLYRWFIDLGVDAVIGHHTHCFSGFEIYKRKPIVYSLGNFIFDGLHKESSWNIGVAAMIILNNQHCDLELYPFTQCDKIVGICMFNDDERTKWLKTESEKINIIQDDNLLKSKFSEFILKQEKLYRSYLEPNTSSWILAAKNRGLLSRTVKGYKQLLLLNIIRAESHRDIVMELLSENNEDCNS